MPMEAARFRSKRGSSEVDDCDECLPISKRINRLHIEGQQKKSDEQFGCTHQEPLNGHGMNNNSQPSASWQDGMTQQPNGLSSQDFLAASGSGALLNGASQYSPQVPHGSMYQGMPGEPRNGFMSAHCPGPGFPDQQQFSQQGPVMNIGPHFAQDTRPGIPEEEAPDSMDYDPELDAGENPHYYNINNVLFNAHCQRMRREGFSIDPGDPGSFS
ncbi:hypothetical protein V1264_011273 [Littorina saxatilis]|uniref:Uncharacterized protein n=1 Tax=Littorina saxatilis TaxID=31220 RepID=A0AAN9GKR3_9CAEN